MEDRTNPDIMEKAAPYLEQLRSGGKKIEESARNAVRSNPVLLKLEESARNAVRLNPVLLKLEESARSAVRSNPVLQKIGEETITAVRSNTAWRKIGKGVRTAAKICADGAGDMMQDVLQDVLKKVSAGDEQEEMDQRNAGSPGYALITGASSGIGREFARRLSLEGYPLILVARRRDRLESLRSELGTECLLLPADLSRQEDLVRLCEDIVGRRIDIFINNAGFGVCGPFMGTDLMREVNMIEVNVTAQHVLLKYVLHRMEAEGGGYILNVASCAGLFPAGPFMSGYYATKAYMASLTRGVAEELRQGGSSVYVGCLCPGPVETEFNDVADVTFDMPSITPEYCVDYALQMMEKGKTVIIPDRRIRAAVVGQRFLPDALTVRITAAQQKKKAGKPEDAAPEKKMQE